MAPRILLVDDEPMLRALIVRALCNEGYEVVEAEDGLVGLDLARNTPVPFDLVITDNRMRGLSGPELAEELRVLHPGLPVLHLSGSRGTDLEEGRVVLYKPFSMADLARMVQSLLNG